MDNPCDSNANCTDTDGSYTCECEPGYTGNGTFCTGIHQAIKPVTFSFLKVTATVCLSVWVRQTGIIGQLSKPSNIFL